jgi:hypothetical protein
VGKRSANAECLQRDRGFGALQLVTTGVAGPVEQEGRPVGTVVLGLALPGSVPDAVELACRAIGSVSGSSRRSRPWTPSDADFVQPDRARRS